MSVPVRHTDDVGGEMKKFILTILMAGFMAISMADIPDGPGVSPKITDAQSKMSFTYGVYTGLSTFLISSFLSGFQTRRAAYAGIMSGFAAGITARLVMTGRQPYREPLSLTDKDEMELFASHGFLKNTGGKE